MSKIANGQTSLFGVPLARPGEPVRRPRKRKALAPLRRCAACGSKFRSWNPDRYCTKASCIEMRGSGLRPDGTVFKELGQSQIGPGDPWPEDFMPAPAEYLT